MTTDNVLRYLGAIEERTIEIISNYQRIKEYTEKCQENSVGVSDGLMSENRLGDDNPFGSSVTQLGNNQIIINPPRLLDYSSSDESGDEGDDVEYSILKPVHRSDINYSRVSASLIKGNSRRKTANGRRGSIAFQAGRRSSVSLLASHAHNGQRH